MSAFYSEPTNIFIDSLAKDMDIVKAILIDADENARELLLKLSVVGLVTKFQVFVESLLSDFLYHLQHDNVRSVKLNDYIKINSVYIQLNKEDDVLKKIRTAHGDFIALKDRVLKELKQFSYLYEDVIIDDSFCFNTKFPIGKTGSEDLCRLLVQFDGDNDPLSCDFDGITMDKGRLDELLGIRNSIVHQDKFGNCTEQKIDELVNTCKTVGMYIDEYVYRKTIAFFS